MRLPLWLLAASFLVTVPATAQIPAPPTADTFYLEGKRQIRAQRPGAAERAFLDGLKLEPRHFQLHLELGRFYLRKSPGKASTHLKQALELRPASDMAQLLMGQYLEGRGKLLDAAERYRQAVRINANQYDADRRLKAILRKLRKARSGVERASEQFWRNPSLAALTLFGRVVMAESDPRQALLEFEQLRARLPELFEGYLWIARAQRRLGSLQGEIEAYRGFLAKNPQALRIRLILVQRLLENDAFVKAKETLEPIAAHLDSPIPGIDPEDHGRIALLLSHIRIAEGDGIEAGRLLLESARHGVSEKEILRAYEDYVAAYPQLGELWLARGQWLASVRKGALAAPSFLQAGLLEPALRDKSRKYLEVLAGSGTGVNEAHLALGELALADRREGEAVAHLARIQPGHPADRRGSLLLGVVRRRRGDLDGSLDALLRYVFSFPNRSGMAYARGNIFWQLGKPEMAAAIWAQDVPVYAQYPDVLERLAGYYRERNQPQAELQARTKLAVARPDQVQNRLRLGRLYEQSGDMARAVEHWGAAVERLPGDHGLRLQLARALLALGRPGAAATHLAKAAEFAPLDFSLTEVLARELMIAGQFREALDIYWRIYQERPQHPDLPKVLPRLVLRVPASEEIRLVAARMARRTGQGDLLLGLLEDTVRLYPEANEAAVMLAGIYLAQGAPEEAERVISRQGGLDALSNMERLQLLAESQHLLGKRNEEAATLARILELDPDNQAAQRSVGLQLAATGDHEGALPLLKEALRSNQRDEEVLMALARSQISGEHLRAVKETLRRLLDVNPNHETALLMLIQRLLEDQDYRAVVEPLEKWVALFPVDAGARFNLIAAYLSQYLKIPAIPHYKALKKLNPAMASQWERYFR